MTIGVLHKSPAIDTPKQLSIALSECAHRIEFEVSLVLKNDHEKGISSLRSDLQLIPHHYSDTEVSTLYAQTIIYTVFTIRWSLQGDLIHYEQITSLINFVSADINRFLNSLLSPTSGSPLDQELKTLIMILNGVDLERVFSEVQDPILYFYETFLSIHCAQNRKFRGVYYTPKEVISTIIMQVHDLLKEEFKLPLGLADSSTWAEFSSRSSFSLDTDIDREARFVKILDPATGTGSFLLNVIEVIYEVVQTELNDQNLDHSSTHAKWCHYVSTELLPRLHGYEISFTPYIIAHIRLGLWLSKSGFTFHEDEILNLELVNALEVPQHYQVSSRHKFSVIVGNPPYSVNSSNMSQHLKDFIDRYRFFTEQKIQEKGALMFERALQNDYVKFIRLSEILSSSIGAIIGLVTSHSYLMGNSYRGLRESLCKDSFNLHYITDLHGNIAEGIYRDENIFDITEGIAILIAAQLSWRNQRRSYFQELIGSRDHKLKCLGDDNHKQRYQQIYPKETNQYSFCTAEHDTHDLGFDTWPALHEIFTHYSSGVISARDRFSTDTNKVRLHERIKRFIHSKNKSNTLLNEFNLKAKKGWSVDRAQMLLRGFLDHQDLESSLYPITYRPFIKRWICYHPSIVWTTAKSTHKHLLNTDNIALISMRQYKKSVPEYSFIFANKGLTEARVFSSQTGVASIFPLWLHSDDEKSAKISNISISFVKSLTGQCDETSVYKTCAYIYALLHSPIYRRLFGEQLKRSFPHIPPICDPHLLEALVICGEQLLSLHTTQDDTQQAKNQPPIKLGLLEKVTYSTDRLQIVGQLGDLDMKLSPDIWFLNIGGYQVLKTWFKHMRGQPFNEQAIDELQKLIECLQQTISLQSKIDASIMQYGGFRNGFKTTFS